MTDKAKETKLNGFTLSEMKSICDRAKVASELGLVNDWTLDYVKMFEATKSIVQKMKDAYSEGLNIEKIKVV